MKKSKIVAIIMMALSSCGIKDEAVFQLNEGIIEVPESWVEKGVSFFSSELSKGYDIEDIEVGIRGRSGVYVHFLNKISGARCSTDTQDAYPDASLTKAQLLKQRQFLAA